MVDISVSSYCLVNWLVIWIGRRRSQKSQVIRQIQSGGSSPAPAVTSSPKNQPRKQLSTITSVFKRSIARHSSSPSSAETSKSSISPSSVLQGQSDGMKEVKSPDTTSHIPCTSCRFHMTSTHSQSSPSWPSVAVVTPVRKRSRPSTPQSNTPTTPGRCQGVTKSGVQCRLPKMAGYDFCGKHVGKRAI